MQLSLRRVRFAFGSLALVLLAGVLSLLESALDRLERERNLRHEVVAERVFDELERELNENLERESARPSSVYDAPTSQVDAWAPFIVGYFTVADQYRVVSQAQLQPARSARIQAALARVWPDPAHTHPGNPASDPGLADAQRNAGAVSDVVAQEKSQALELTQKSAPKLKSQKALDNSPEVLRRLNRAQDARKTQVQTKQDPFAY